jgi:uncharacterized protein (DUF1330 family)
MAAYVVSEIEATAAEGAPPPQTIVIVEFPSMERLREWYARIGVRR